MGGRTRVVIDCVYHDRGNLSRDGSIARRGWEGAWTKNVEDAETHYFAAHLSRLLFHRRQAPAVSSARMGCAPHLFSAAVMGGIQPTIVTQLLWTTVGSLVCRREKYFASDARGADADIDRLRCDIVGDSSVRA